MYKIAAINNSNAKAKENQDAFKNERKSKVHYRFISQSKTQLAKQKGGTSTARGNDLLYSPCLIKQSPQITDHSLCGPLFPLYFYAFTINQPGIQESGSNSVYNVIICVILNTVR